MLDIHPLVVISDKGGWVLFSVLKLGGGEVKSFSHVVWLVM